jgi:hypothetical protein
MEHPPCSPHFAPNGFWLFPKLKSALKGRRFEKTEDDPTSPPKKVMVVKAIPQQVFQKCFQQW